MQTTGLLRADIVGKRVLDILESPCHIDDDGCGASEVYVQLDDDILLLLDYSDDLNPPPIPRADPSIRSSLTFAADNFRQAAIGKVVVEVVCSYQWLGVGLLLEGDTLICSYDALIPRVVGACVDTLGSYFRREDITTYWGQMPIE